MTMRCPECSCAGKLKVMHTYSAGPEGETRDLLCDKCGTRFASITILRVSGPRKRRGHGAAALARKMENGVLLLKEDLRP